MAAEACVRWRNFVCTAQDLVFSGTAGSPIEINLSNQLLQGANPLDFDVINEKNFQGGFRLNYVCTQKPKYGTLEPGTFGTGWRYYTISGSDSFVDEFYYVLSNGTQVSGEAKVTLYLDPGLSGSFTIYRARNRPYWKFKGDYAVPNLKPRDPLDVLAPPQKVFGDNGSFQSIRMSIVEKRAMRVMFIGQPYIYENYSILKSAETSYVSGQTSPQGSVETDWLKYEWPDPNLSGYIPNTAVPYIQPAGPFPITLRIDYFSTPIYREYGLFEAWGTHDLVEIDVVLLLGSDWWNDGRVIYVEADDAGFPSPDFYP